VPSAPSRPSERRPPFPHARPLSARSVRLRGGAMHEARRAGLRRRREPPCEERERDGAGWKANTSVLLGRACARLRRRRRSVVSHGLLWAPHGGNEHPIAIAHQRRSPRRGSAHAPHPL
jgi:hypothetical protein